MKKIHGKKITSYSVLVCLISMLIVCLKPGGIFLNGLNEANVTRLSSEELTKADTVEDEITSGASFGECKVFGIKKLIRDYYDAYLAEDDNELLKYIDTYGNMNIEEQNFARQYIEQYMDIRCYYMEASIKNAYLVVSYGYAKCRDIDTTIPVVDTFFVRMNSSGNYYICNSAASDESAAYNELMFEGSQVLELKSMAQYELDTACEVDSNLSDFVNSNSGFFNY